MKNIYTDDHVFPRPTERLPDFAHAKARQTCAEKLIEAFTLTADAAQTIANAVVDPAAVRKSIGDPADPQVEEVSVTHGILLGIRTKVWARKIMPDPRNPRIGPSRRHPFAVDPGSGAEDSKFRPVPEPRTPSGAAPDTAQLTVDIDSRHHLNWASQQAAEYVLTTNDWRESIASQGVMEHVWAVATTYEHADGFDPVTSLTSVEGSSRMTSVHNLLGVRSADIPYDDSDAKLRVHYRNLNAALDRGPTGEESVFLRCEQVPALILVGFRPHPTASTSFPTAVRSLVALRHVDPPRPWGEGPENEALADEVLDEFYRTGLISATQRDYFAGSCTRSEAMAAHLSDDPAVRAASIIRMFTSRDERVVGAIRVAVTSQSTRKRITPKLCDELATALILRAVAGDPAKSDQIRRYLRDSFGKAAHREAWQSTNRSVEALVTEALAEVKRTNATDPSAETGPASLELAVRGAYALVVSGRLSADRGTAHNQQPDRRNPGEVLDAMRRTLQGVHQLAQSLRDFQGGEMMVAVDEEGAPKKLRDGSGLQSVSDVYLRGEFPPPGKARAPRPGDTPLDVYANRISDLSLAVEKLEEAFAAVGQVVGDDGRPLVDTRGADWNACRVWREVLRRIDEDLVMWGGTFKRTFGTGAPPTVNHGSDNDNDDQEFDTVHWSETEQDLDSDEVEI